MAALLPVGAAAAVKLEDYGSVPGEIFRNLILGGQYRAAKEYISENAAARESIGSVKTGDCLIEDLLESDRENRLILVWQVATILHGNDIPTKYSNLCRALAQIESGNPDGYFELRTFAQTNGYKETVESYLDVYKLQGKDVLIAYFKGLTDKIAFIEVHPDVMAALHAIMMGDLTLDAVAPIAADDSAILDIETLSKEVTEKGFIKPGQIGDLLDRLLQQIRSVKETGQLLKKPALEEADKKV
ncbi:MAG: hypothetical protein K1X28_04625 [Parachlamydiales bacterium]|nr:hypothetical protein [Parachlamydiales bacterium]